MASVASGMPSYPCGHNHAAPYARPPAAGKTNSFNQLRNRLIATVHLPPKTADREDIHDMSDVIAFPQCCSKRLDRFLQPCGYSLGDVQFQTMLTVSESCARNKGSSISNGLHINNKGTSCLRPSTVAIVSTTRDGKCLAHPESRCRLRPATAKCQP